MSLLPQLTRTVIAGLLVSTVTSCEYLSAAIEDGFPTEKVNDAYKARDTCLKWAIVSIDDGQTDPAKVGARAAHSCSAETGALVGAIDPHGDPAIASRTEADSALRATGYVINTRKIAGDVASGRFDAQKR